MTCATFQVEGVPDFLVPASRDNSIACTCLLFYSLQVAKQKDHVAVMRILPALTQCDADIVYQDTFLHLLISYLACMPDHFASSDFYGVVVELFLMVSIDMDTKSAL